MSHSLLPKLSLESHILSYSLPLRDSICESSNCFGSDVGIESKGRTEVENTIFLRPRQCSRRAQHYLDEIRSQGDNMNKQKAFSLLIIIGASILLFRTIRLLTVENGWETLATWVIVLTFIEMFVDICCIIFSFQWLLKLSLKSKLISLRLAVSSMGRTSVRAK